MRRSFKVIGFRAHGQLRMPHCPLPARSCSLWSWQYICGVLSGSLSVSSLCATMKQLWRSLNLLGYLSLLVVCHSFPFTPVGLYLSSVRGKANPVANALSASNFRQLVPHADHEVTEAPQYLLASLLVV